MSGNYIIVLFNNKKKKKFIKHYIGEKRAKAKFNALVETSNKIMFEKQTENATPCYYELGLLTNKSKTQKSLFTVDELGRNNPVNLDDPDYVFLDIKKYKMEETIFDWQTEKKITFNELILTYFKKKELKNVFTLHNKLCIQIDLDVYIFSLKNSDDSERLLYVLQDYFIENKRNDGIFVRDISTTQRKWIYEVLVDKGFDKKRLYRLKTTFSKR